MSPKVSPVRGLSCKSSANHVHLIVRGSLRTWLFVQFLDGVGMKYTGLILSLALATVMGGRPLCAQTSYVAAGGLSVNSPGIDTTQPNSVITIQKRVNEVNVLFIAMDK